MTKVNNSYLIMTLLFLIFFVPLGIAWGVYHYGFASMLSKNNYGELINPPISFSEINLHLSQPSADSESIHSHNVKKQKPWILLYIMPSHCTTVCQHNLHSLRQIHLALEKDQNRVQRIVAGSYIPLETSNFLRKEYPEITATFISPEALQRLTTSLIHRNQLYLVDPRNNIMMHYPSNFAARKLYDDLKRLLRVSQIG